jgi:hypothetical protein
MVTNRIDTISFAWCPSHCSTASHEVGVGNTHEVAMGVSNTHAVVGNMHEVGIGNTHDMGVDMHDVVDTHGVGVGNTHKVLRDVTVAIHKSCETLALCRKQRFSVF